MGRIADSDLLEQMPRPLFIIGNKRSGTSQLVRVLNLHPQVFISHESDIAWILYQFYHNLAFRAHVWDSDRGMRTTLEAAENLLRPESSPLENFIAIQTLVMRNGSPWLPAQNKTGLRWLGDKKPMQHTDPDLLQFMLDHFPDARFLHIVRHPFEVVESSDRFNQTPDGDFWLDLSTEEKIERWAFHESQVLQLKQDFPGRVYSLRYEDLCRNTEQELIGIFGFLELVPETLLLKKAARLTRPLVRPITTRPCSAQALQIAAIYGYDLHKRQHWLNTRLEQAYWHLVKMFQ